MADLSRTDAPRPAERAGGAGETKIEQLLLAGLDHYFAGEYERAISVWTRVLFFDRSHPRARAYIERARSAVAERQRESEELMHRGVDAFGRGEAERARALLTTAVERGGPHDVAVAFLDRLDRLQPAPAPAPRPDRAAPPPRGHARRARTARLPRHGLWLLPAFVLVVAVAVAIFYVTVPGDRLPAVVAPDAVGAPPRPAAAERDADTMPVPRPADIALARARAAMSKGNLKEALRALELVGLGSADRAEVDRLRAEIQRTLLSDAGTPARPASRAR
jgi:hypothetical protein